MKCRLALVVTAVIGVVLWVDAGPAQAVDVAGGAAAFTGKGRLPVAPCSGEGPDGPSCEGTWHGTFTGGFSGVHTTDDGRLVPWTVEVDAPGRAHINHIDASEAGSPCDAAVLKTRASFSGGPGQVFGAYGHYLPVPSAIVGMTLSLEFEWYPKAGSGDVLATRWFIELEVYGNGRITVVDATHEISTTDAVASFVPDDPGVCAQDAPTALDGVVSAKLSGIAVRAN